MLSCKPELSCFGPPTTVGGLMAKRGQDGQPKKIKIKIRLGGMVAFADVGPQCAAKVDPCYGGGFVKIEARQLILVTPDDVKKRRMTFT